MVEKLKEEQLFLIIRNPKYIEIIKWFNIFIWMEFDFHKRKSFFHIIIGSVRQQKAQATIITHGVNIIFTTLSIFQGLFCDVTI